VMDRWTDRIDHYNLVARLLWRVLAIAILSVRLSVTRVNQSKTVQAKIPNLYYRLPGRL